MDHHAEFTRWLHSAALSPEEKEELRAIEQDPKEIESRFFAPLDFGTAGLRGTMALGLHHMNVHVIRWVTQGFAQVIAAYGEVAKERGVAICMDCRVNSEAFARAAACVMAANGIQVYLFSSLRPTPELSFAVREYGCQAGINITASHNPKEYNGYKVYWEDGAQLPPKEAAAIAREIQSIDIFEGVRTMPYEQALAQGRIRLLGEETDEKFMARVLSMMHTPETIRPAAADFSMVYTPFHGCGHRLVPQALRALGIQKLYCQEEQMLIDGTFPTVESPNPENPEGFALSMALADRVGADFILGTDPDADRVGLMVRDKEGKFRPLTGNQTGVLLLDYLIGAMGRAGRLPEKPVVLKTIVTTTMANRVAEAHGIPCYDTFTGFKFMAEKKNRLESAGEGQVIFSYEESYGYMLGDYVRDKDAVTASLLLTEMAVWYHARGMSLLDALEALYDTYGYYAEKTYNLVMPGLEGLEKMQALMECLRKTPPEAIGGSAVSCRKDYRDGSVFFPCTGECGSMELSGSNVLRFELENGTTVLVRPSGTEPKIKVYVLARGSCCEEAQQNEAACGAWVATLQS